MGIVFGLILAFLAKPSLSDEKTKIAEENQFLREELNLAKTSSLYFILDFQERNILLKAKGIVLKEWKIGSIRFWGSPPPFALVSILKKSTLFPPKRKSIKPGESEDKDKFELEALELKDMPSSFTLFLGCGISIYVRAKSHNFGSRLGSIGHFFRWYAWFPIRNLWLSLKKKPYTLIDVKFLDISEARSVYWSLPDGVKGLIRRSRKT